jgi:diguanylate cyclase (GGDEF)-like protein
VIRITRSLTLDLALWMSLFGLVVGVAFPFFAVLIGVEPDTALSAAFVGSTAAAGLLVGGLSFLIARAAVVPRLRALALSMGRVSAALRSAQFDDDWTRCDASDCLVAVDCHDAVGAAGEAFNGLIETLFRIHRADDKLRRFTRAITSRLDVEEVGRASVDFLLDQVDAAGAALYVEDAGELRLVAAHGLVDAEGLARSPRLLRALEAQEPTVIDLPEDLLVDGVLARIRPKEVLLAPLRFRDQALGVLLIASSRSLDPDTRGLLSLITKGLALSLNNALAHDQLERIAALDPLTGLYNRRFGIERLGEELSRAARNGVPLSVILFDIDHFKRVNDSHGHLAGDRVIRRLAQVARTAIRKGDLLVRYGGEEFIAVLPGAGIDDARDIAERIRRMSEDAVCQEQGRAIRFTVSLGCAAYPDQGDGSAESLLRSADQALYAAKDAGRNRTVANLLPHGRGRLAEVRPFPAGDGPMSAVPLGAERCAVDA